MMFGSFYYKRKAKELLRGSWQNAMLVAFFSGILSTVLQVLQLVLLPNQANFASVEKYAEALMQVPERNLFILLSCSLLTLVLSPVLGLGCNHYFVELTRKNDLGFAGLFSRMRMFGKALWLYLRVFVQIFLWSLLLLIPGIVAAVRYSMAPYFLAENPEMTVSEALRRSKTATEGRKMEYFSLVLSFVVWTMLALILEMFLGEFSPVLGTVASLAVQVWVAAYQNGAVAVFYRTACEKNGIRKAFDDMLNDFAQMGMDPESLEQMKVQAEERFRQTGEQPRQEDGASEDKQDLD